MIMPSNEQGAERTMEGVSGQTGSRLAMLSIFAAVAVAAGATQAQATIPKRNGATDASAGKHKKDRNVRRRATRAPARAHASIIGGYIPDASQWPWMAYLHHSDGTFCGGALVAPTRVLTAAHCVTEDDGTISNPSSMQIVIGRRTLSSTATGETLEVAAVARNPQFTKRIDNSLDYDTAVLTLSRAASAQPATLGVESDWGKEVTVMGWGHTNHENNEYSNDLLAVDLPTWTDEQCESAWGADYDRSTNFCAGYYDGSKAVCHGDSGGPVMTTPDQGTTWKLIGIVSVVKAPCNVPGYPGIFAWVAGATLRPWVVSALTQAPPSPPPPSPPPVAPQAPPVASAPSRVIVMSKGDAIHDLKRLIRSKTHHAATRLSVRCRRTSNLSFSCKASFRAGQRRYAGRFRVRQYEYHGVLYWTGVFTGVRSDKKRINWT